MQYILILQTALAIAKAVQQDHPELPGSDKFGILIDLLISVFGSADITKYKAAIQVVVTLAVDAWKAANAFGFVKTPAPAATTA